MQKYVLEAILQFNFPYFTGKIVLIARKITCAMLTVWKFRKFSPTANIFRQIDSQYNSLVKKLIFAKNRGGKICKFPHCVDNNFSWNWFTVKLFSEKVDLTEFLQNIVEEKFANFYTTVQCGSFTNFPWNCFKFLPLLPLKNGDFGRYRIILHGCLLNME